MMDFPHLMLRLLENASAKFQNVLILVYYKVLVFINYCVLFYIFLNCVLDEICHRLCVPKYLLRGGEDEAGHQERNR